MFKLVPCCDAIHKRQHRVQSAEGEKTRFCYCRRAYSPLGFPNPKFPILDLFFSTPVVVAILGHRCHRHSPSPSPSPVVGRCEPNSDSDDFNTKTSCSLKKYLMTSYFEKYDCFCGSNFHDFVIHELHSCLCDKLPENTRPVIRQSVLQHNLIGEGSHRRLSSSIRFDIDPKLVSEIPNKCCEVIFVERLPTGVFADPFELQHLHQRGVFTDVAVFGDTNLELPSFLSNQSVVEVHMKVDPNSFLTHKSGLEILVELPLHARYQRLDETGYSIVKFGDADLFMHCGVEGNLHNKSCLYIPMTNSAESRIGIAEWKIPSGMKAHSRVVSFVTFISAFLSTLAIVLTSISFSDIKPSKSLKQL